MKVANYTSQRKAQVSVRVTYNSAIDLLFALWILGARMVGEGLAELDLGDEWFDDLAAGMSKQTAEDLESLGLSRGDTIVVGPDSAHPMLSKVVYAKSRKD